MFQNDGDDVDFLRTLNQMLCIACRPAGETVPPPPSTAVSGRSALTLFTGGRPRMTAPRPLGSKTSLLLLLLLPPSVTTTPPASPLNAPLLLPGKVRVVALELGWSTNTPIGVNLATKLHWTRVRTGLRFE